jgi:hypothetical protein
MMNVPMEDMGFAFCFCGHRIREWDCPFCGCKNINGQSVCECGACSKIDIKNDRQVVHLFRGNKCYEEILP